MENHLKQLLRFLHETEPGLKEVQILVVHAIKYINNHDRPADYNGIIFVIKKNIDNNLCNHKVESYTRAVRKLVELGKIERVKPGLFYHPGTIYGRHITPQKTFTENKRSIVFRGCPSGV